MAGIITTISPIRSPKKLKNTSTNNTTIESPVLGLREDFETSINNLVDNALLALKRKVLDVKKVSSLSSSLSSTTTKPDPLLESYKSQISSDSHIVYDYSQELDASVMKHLIFQLYKLLLHPTERSDSIFMQARRATEYELRLKEQECVVLKKQINHLENSLKQVGNQSTAELEGISTKVLELEHKLMSSSLKVLKQKKSELQAVNLTNALRASNGYSSDLKQLNDALQRENDLLKEKHQKVLQQVALGEQQLKDVKQANIELDVALKYQILHTNQLQDQLLHLEYNNLNLTMHSQQILGALPNSKDIKSTTLPSNSTQRATQIPSNIVNRDRSPDKSTRVPQEFFGETTTTTNEINNYKFDYIKLSEFTLSLVAQLLESGPTIQLQPLRHHLEAKRKDIQLRYIEATTLPRANTGSHKKPIFQQQQVSNK